MHFYHDHRQNLRMSVVMVRGGGGKATMIFGPFGLHLGVMVMWSKISDHNHGQNPNFTWSKWSTSNIIKKFNDKNILAMTMTQNGKPLFQP